MSAEAPKQTNVTAHPSSPEVGGCLPGFLRKFFAAPSAVQLNQQPVSRTAQPSPDLEGFAVRIQQGIDNHIATVRQEDLDRHNAEVARLSSEAMEIAQAEAKRREIEQQERIKKEEAMAEATKILKDFHIEEKLEYIRQRYWEGKGEVNVHPLLGISMSRNDGLQKAELRGGFELIYRFTDFAKVHDKWEHRVHGGQHMSREKSKIVTREKSTRLGIALIDEQGEKVLRVSSVLSFDESDKSELIWTIGRDFSIFEGARIPVDAEDREVLLETTLALEIVRRRESDYFPVQIEEKVKREHAILRQQLAGYWTDDPPYEND